jgi:molybdenum cofactor cytidylyltransferase
MTVPILILAGGASSRMGAREKLLEPVGGQPLLRLQAWRALKASREVTVLIRPGQPAVRRALAGLPLHVLVASEAFEGMGGSIRAGTRAHLRSRSFLMMLADLVEIEAQDLRAVMAARATHAEAAIWRGATEDGEPGHPILFDRAVYGDLLNLRGDDGGRRIMERWADRVVLVPLKGKRARRDLDTPEEWDNWRAQREAGDAPD